MRVITWVVEGTWGACIGATRMIAPGDAEVVLLHVTGGDAAAAAHAAYAGLLGRGPRRDRDPGLRLAELGATSAAELLQAAAHALGRPCSLVERHGRVEREVVAVAEGADLLVVARDGDDTRLGPKSLGPASRFVVDHAPCPVLLVWPRETPGTGSIPPPPDHPHGHPPPHPPGLAGKARKAWESRDARQPGTPGSPGRPGKAGTPGSPEGSGKPGGPAARKARESRDARQPGKAQESREARQPGKARESREARQPGKARESRAGPGVPADVRLTNAGGKCRCACTCIT